MSSGISKMFKGPNTTIILQRNDLQAEMQTLLGKEEKEEKEEKGEKVEEEEKLGIGTKGGGESAIDAAKIL